MTIISTNSIDWKIVSIVIICIFVIVGGISVIGLAVVKNKDKGKELIRKRGKIIQKTVSQGNIAWYIIEFENGERIQLRTFHDFDLMLKPDDNGMIAYRGKTIEKFTKCN